MKYGTENEITASQVMPIHNLTVVNHLSQSYKTDLLELYQNAWWSCDRTLKDIETMLAGSSFIIGLVESTSDRLIGFSRILTDYFLYAYLYDVIVHPHYRGQSLGKKLMTVILEHPAIKDIKSLELVCRKNMVPFYQQFGFTEDFGLSIAMRKLRGYNT